MSWPSPTIPKLMNPDNPLGRQITSDEASWLASFLLIGCLIGNLLCAAVAKHFGRKLTLIALSAFLLLSYITLAFAKLIILYYLARVVAGFAVGGLFSVVPIFIGEISEVHNRGILITSYGCFMTAGMLFTYCVGPYTTILVFNLICALFSIIFICLFFVLVPETPAYLLKINKEKEARCSLKKLRGHSEEIIQKEIEEIMSEIQRNSQGSIKDLIYNKGLMKALGVTLILVALQQSSGIVAVASYTQTIFEEAGSSIPSEISSIITGVFQVVGSFVPPFIVDRWGRRILLITSSLGITVSYFLLGLYFYLQQETEVDVSPVSWLPVVTLSLYIITYKIGLSTVPFALIGEVFPSNVRPYASSFATFPNWIIAFVFTKYFPFVVDKIGMGGSFWIFSGFGLLATLFSFFCVLETQRKTFEEIQIMYGS